MIHMTDEAFTNFAVGCLNFGAGFFNLAILHIGSHYPGLTGFGAGVSMTAAAVFFYNAYKKQTAGPRPSQNPNPRLSPRPLSTRNGLSPKS